MMRPQAPKLQIPRSPAFPRPLQSACPRNWTLKPLFDPKVRSYNSMLRCLDASIRTDSDSALVLTLDLKYYDPSPSPKSCVKILLGNIGVTTNVETADSGNGSTSVWGVLPGAALKEGLPVTLQVLEDDSLERDKLPIGVVSLGPVQTAAELRKKRAFASLLPDRISSPSSPPVAVDDLEDCPSEVPIDEGPFLTKEAIPPDYERLSFAMEDGLDAATDEKWTLEEETAGRRLVRFRRSLLGSNVRLNWTTHAPTHFCGPDEVVISCMKLPELGGHFITSFDIVKLAEYILDLSLNTDMKNRARRNMASISCNTLDKISAADASPTNDFIAVMRFENPKPRSIEKSIKVYHWSLLQLCLTKILQRFIIYLPYIPTGPAGFEHQLEATNKWKRNKRNSNKPYSSRPAKTRRESKVHVQEHREPLRSKRILRESQVSHFPTTIKALSEDETPTIQEQFVKQEEEYVKASPKEEHIGMVTPTRDHEETASNGVLQPSPRYTPGTMLPAVSSSSVMLPNRRVQPTQVVPQTPVHPSLQRGYSSNKLAIPHQGWTIPSSSEAALASPTGSFTSSFESGSPTFSNANPQYSFANSNTPDLQQYYQNNTPSVSRRNSVGPSLSPDTPFGSSSTLVAPIWPSNPHLGIGPMSVEYRYISHPSTPVHSESAPVLVRGFNVNPTYVPYHMDSNYVYQLLASSQETLVTRTVVKEEPKEIDTDEWLDNDYIAAQEKNFIG